MVDNGVVLRHEGEEWSREPTGISSPLLSVWGAAATDLYVGGMLDMSGGHIHPLNLVLGEAAAVESLGGIIHEQSRVTRVDQGEHPVVHTEQGQVKARFVVVAGNAYLGDLIPQLAAKSMPCGTQVVATEPLSAEVAYSLLPQDYCVEDCSYLLDYYRLSGDRRLIFGGGVVYGARDPADVVLLVRPNLVRTFPQLKGVKIDYAWTGNFLLTLSRLPQVGRIGSNIYYSQGCSGHGVTFTRLSASTHSPRCRTTRSPGVGCCVCHSRRWVPGTTRCATSSASEKRLANQAWCHHNGTEAA